MTKTKDYIPSVYAVADKLAFDKKAQTVRVSLTKAHDLKQGDKVRLIGDEGLLEKDVVAVPDAKTFVVSSFVKEPKRLFVYGKQVDDFLAVDYNRIFSPALADSGTGGQSGKIGSA